MYRLERPEYLYVLILIPLFIWIIRLLYVQRKKRLASFGNLSMLRGFDPGLFGKPVKLQVLGSLTILFISLALTNPQFGSNKHSTDISGNDVFILFDVSKSMTANDIKPSRLEIAKNFATKLIERLKSNKIGLIVFAGKAYLQMPLTEDYTAAISFVETAEPEMVPTQGTAIGPAIESALSQFDMKAQTNKAIVILSDGEDHDDGAKDAAKKAAKVGVRVFTVGVGTGTGGNIPVYNGGRVDTKKDEDGRPVVTKLDEAALIGLAQIGNGSYHYVRSDQSAINALTREISSTSSKVSKSSMHYDYDNYFYWFLLAGMITLFLSWFRFKRNKVSKLTGVFVLLGFTSFTYSQETINEARNADNLYKSGNFAQAENKYDRVSKQNPTEFKYIYNKANAQYKQKKYKESAEEYQRVLDASVDKRLKTKANYNKGNALYEQKQYAEAIKSYKEALKENPYDMDVKKNISIALKQLKKEQQQKQDQKDQYKSKDKEKNKEQGNKPKSKAEKRKEQETQKMLQIIDNEEKNVMRKLPKESAEPPVNGKDW